MQALRRILVLAVGAFASPAFSATGFLSGEVLVGGRPAYAFEGGNGYIQAYDTLGRYQRDAARIANSHPRDAVMFGSDVLFADIPGIVRLKPDGSLSIFATSGICPSVCLSIAIDGQNNLLVGDFIAASVTKVDSGGHVVATYELPRDTGTTFTGTLTMDLAADQCTLFYATGGSRIKRYDVCHQTSLPDFFTFGAGGATKLRALSDGDLLAASTNGIVRFSSDGSVVRIYGVGAGWGSLSVLASGNAIWAGSQDTLGARIVEFSLDDGAVLAGPTPTLLPVPPFNPGDRLPREFVQAIGERRAAQGADLVETAPVPALSTIMQIGLLLFLAGVAMNQLR